MLTTSVYNDVFPTAMHIAIALKTKEKLLPSLKLLEKELAKIERILNIVKLRTHLQDATPLTRSRISGYHTQLKMDITEAALKEIYQLAQEELQLELV